MKLAKRLFRQASYCYTGLFVDKVIKRYQRTSKFVDASEHFLADMVSLYIDPNLVEYATRQMIIKVAEEFAHVELLSLNSIYDQPCKYTARNAHAQLVIGIASQPRLNSQHAQFKPNEAYINQQNLYMVILIQMNWCIGYHLILDGPPARFQDILQEQKQNKQIDQNKKYLQWCMKEESPLITLILKYPLATGVKYDLINKL